MFVDHHLYQNTSLFRLGKLQIIENRMTNIKNEFYCING